MPQLIPIHIRIDFMRAAEPSYSGFLLPDGCNALYVSDESAFLLPVTPSGYDGLYAQAGDAALVAVEIDGAAESVEILYRRLTEMSAFELLTRHYNAEMVAYTI
jgi:hypothetical protein